MIFLKKTQKNIANCLLFLQLAICYLFLFWQTRGVEIFGVNGFYNKDLNWLGFLLSGICLNGATCLGYYLFKDNQNKNIWITFIICIIVALICLVLFCEVLKAIQHRPGFRLLAANSNIAFHNWWERCENYKEPMNTYDITKNNFKSFPSGHTIEAYLLFIPCIVLPLSNKKYENIQMPLFICVCVFAILTALARILAAAHFLSDVSIGVAFTTCLIIISSEIITRNTKLNNLD